MQISIELVGAHFFKQKVLYEILEILNKNSRVGHYIEAKQEDGFSTTSKRMYGSKLKETNYIRNKDSKSNVS